MSVRIVKFNCHGCHAPAYGCSFPGDNTGDYVLHSDYATLLARHNALVDAVVHIYNSGYHAGHHFTVEGGYVDIHSSDMDSYHAEEVAELLTALVGEEGR